MHYILLKSFEPSQKIVENTSLFYLYEIEFAKIYLSAGIIFKRENRIRQRLIP